MTTSSELSAMVAEIKALLAKATPGPWRQGAYDMSAILWSDETHRNGFAKQIATTGPKEDWRGAVQQADDAALIVAAVNALPTLLADLERMQAALEPFAMVALEGKNGGEFVICKALYTDMASWQDSPPRESHLHKEDFVRARAALQTRKAKP